MDSNTPNDGNTPKALEPIQRATVEEILELYPDHPQASAMLFNYYYNAPDCHEQSAILRQLGTLADYYRDRPLPLALLQDRAENDISGGIRQAAVEAIGKYHHDDPQTYSWLCDRAQNPDNAYVRKAAVEAIGKYYQDNPQTYSWLCDRVQNSDDKNVCFAAVEAIGDYYHNEPQTLALLRDRAQNSDDEIVRFAAVEAIGDYYHNEPQTLALLRDRYQNDQSYWIQEVSLRQISKHYQDDPQTFPLLLHQLQNPRSHLATQAIRLLAQYYQDNSQTLPLLQNFIQSLIQNEDESLKRNAVDALKAVIKDYRDKPQTLPLLLEFIQTNQNTDNYDYNALESAVDLLVENYRDNPQTLAVLHHLGQKRLRYSTKKKLMEILVNYYHNDPQTLPFLLDVSQNDDYITIRENSLQLIAYGYRDNPETLPLLRQCIDQYVQQQQGLFYHWVMDTVGECFAGDSQLLSWLKDLICNTETPSGLRAASVKVLGEHFLSNSEAIELLNDLAAHEPDEQIRLTASRGIAKHAQQTKSDRPDESKTLPDISIEIPEIPTDCDSDYTRLRDLLKAQLWREAESVTYALIREKLGRKIGKLSRLQVA